jgi:GTP pyrophosphokinase
MAEKQLIQQEETADYLLKTLEETIHKYHPSDDLTMVLKAYQLANEAHGGQLRKSGEPYIIHPLHVAIILAELRLDKESIVAGILHDVVEDTHYTLEEISEMFSPEIASLVDGVTKLTQLPLSRVKTGVQADKLEVQAETLRKMFLAMAQDIRVILIKLADRLHNMRTLQYMKPEKQKEKARETMDIYAPIAQRLGISKIKIELDDLSLKYLEPEVYEDLKVKIAACREERETFVQEIAQEVAGHMKDAGIKAEVSGRAKHFFSIYKKMVNQHKTLEQIYDLFAVRIIVDSVKDCYAALGIIHEMYKPIPGRFKDYIAMPKANNYQSLHTTLIANNGKPFEIQIRTVEMHQIAEYGIAAHWKYKEGKAGENIGSREIDKMAWLRQILEYHKDMADNHEFVSTVKSDLDMFAEPVYCFTPTGEIKSLPAGSTPVDFAYSIHSAVGNKMVGAKVNDKVVPIDYQIQNGDRVSIITSQNSKGPSRDWLKIVKSSQAKNKINQWFKTEFREDNIIHGKELLDKYCKSKGIVFSEIATPEGIQKVIKKYGFKEWNAVLAAIGHGGLKEGQVVNKLQEERRMTQKKEITDEQVLQSIADNKKVKQVLMKKGNGFLVGGVFDSTAHCSRCCNPLPGDEIIGFVTRGRGISVHRTDCPNVIHLPESEKNRLTEVEWLTAEDVGEKGSYAVTLKIYAHDRTSFIVDISKVIAEMDISINAMNSRTNKQEIATCSLEFEISSVDKLNHLIKKLRQIEGVIEVERSKG